jgi:nucleolar pre-ribosomal-associated protein 2
MLSNLDRLGLELPGNIFREMLQNVFWIASASLPGVASSDCNAWLRINPDAFPGLWVSALLSPTMQNNEALTGKPKEEVL